MNTRMKELFQQAASYANEVLLDSHAPWSELMAEKLIELVAQDCANIAVQSNNDPDKSALSKVEATRIYHNILNHVGD